MGKTSRDKGKRGEREVVALVKRLWRAVTPRRTAQVDGTLSADVIGALTRHGHEWHIEVKRYAKLPTVLKRWISQVNNDAGCGRWVLFMREDNGEWYVAMPAEYTYAFAKALCGQAERLL